MANDQFIYPGWKKGGSIKDIMIEEELGDRLGQTRDTGTAEKSYKIFFAQTSDEAYLKFRSFIMAEHQYSPGGLPVESIDVEENTDGSGIFTGKVKYSPWEFNKGTLERPQYSFSTKGGTAKVTQSPLTVAWSGITPIPNFMGGIGYEGGTFQGVEKVAPNYSHSISVTLPGPYVTPAYRKMLYQLTGSVNLNPFDIFAPGECLFNGVDGTTRVEGEWPVWDLKFEFLGQPNAIIQIANFPPVPKTGWDYVWVLRQEVDDEEVGETIMQPRAAYVERLYPWFDFSVFNFGVV